MRWPKPVVIALAGPTATGKTTTAKFLKDEFGFKVVTTRDIIGRFILSDGKEINDVTLQEYGSTMITEEESQTFCEEMISRIIPTENYVVDSLRPISHYNYLSQNLDNFYLAYIHAPVDSRSSRFVKRRDGRSTSKEDFLIRESNAVEQQVARLMDFADNIFLNRDLRTYKAQLQDWIHQLQYSGKSALFQSLIGAVKDFHLKNGYDVATGDIEVMSYRIGLMIEELGEIHTCISKGTGDIAEEHADLLYLLLGNSVTLGFDLEEAFFKKHEIVMRRKGKKVGKSVRVSNWRKETE